MMRLRHAGDLHCETECPSRQPQRRQRQLLLPPSDGLLPQAAGHSAPRREVAAWPSWLTALLPVTVSGLFLLTLIACAPAIPLSLSGQTTEKTAPQLVADDHGDTPDTASPMTPGTPISGQIELSADVDFFKVAVVPTSVRIVAATTGPGDTVVRIEGLDEASSTAHHLVWGDLRSPRPEYLYIRVSGDHATPYELAVWMVKAHDPVRGDEFDIELRYLGTEPTESQQGAFAGAADIWEGVIARGLPDLPVPTATWKCEEDDPSLFGDYVDDLLIYVRVEAVDGADGAVAQTTICARRSEDDGGLPFIGSMTFDEADLAALEANEFLQPMVVHQMAHVLGFGLLWDEEQFRLLEHPSVAPGGVPVPGRDTHFAGRQATGAFDEVGGGLHVGAKVPVENDTGRYGSEALDVHWRESVFGAELMSSTLNAAQAPLSRVTTASLADLGYQVNHTGADTWLLPGSGAGTSLRRAALDAVHVHDDLRRAPINGGRSAQPTHSV